MQPTDKFLILIYFLRRIKFVFFLLRKKTKKNVKNCKQPSYIDGAEFLLTSGREPEKATLILSKTTLLVEFRIFVHKIR